MAELVDALDSKSGYRKVVQVRFLFWAQKQNADNKIIAAFCFFIHFNIFRLSPLFSANL
jgi:hypothetical protein